jgi:hypothetical protein
MELLLLSGYGYRGDAPAPGDEDEGVLRARAAYRRDLSALGVGISIHTA